MTDQAIAALITRDDGTVDDPRTPGEWDAERAVSAWLDHQAGW